MGLTQRRPLFLLLLCCLLCSHCLFAKTYQDEHYHRKDKKEHHKRRSTRRVHSAGLGLWHTVAYTPNPDATNPTPGQLRIRPLIVDGRLAEWTTGEPHMVTAQTFVVQQALRVNNALPTDPKPNWIWQLGPWLMANRSTGHVTTLHLPDFYPSISEVVWFQNYAAYCGLKPTGQFVYGIIVEAGVRKALASQKIAPWSPVSHPTPACAPALWQLDPLRVTLEPTAGRAVTYRVDDGFAIPYQAPTTTPAATTTQPASVPQ